LGEQITVATASGTSQPLLLPVAIVEELRFSLNSCKYSYLCSWCWVEKPPETCRAVHRCSQI